MAKKQKKRMRAWAKTWIILLVVSIFCGAAGGVFLIKKSDEFANEHLLDNLDPGGVVNILLLGTDGGEMRSDTIMLVNINGETGKINVLSIPRDTAIVSRNSEGKIEYKANGTPRVNKINAYLGIGKSYVNKGKCDFPEEIMAKKVKEITGLPIHYYATVNFEGFKEIIDILGGVDFDVPEDMNYDDPAQDLHIHLKKGQQHLNGQKAHDFVRYRKYKNGRADLARVEAQQNFIKALVEQKLTASNLAKFDDIYNQIAKHVRTNYGLDDLMRNLGTIKSIKKDDVTMYMLPNTPKYIDGVSYVVYNTPEHLEELDEILENFRSEEQKKNDK